MRWDEIPWAERSRLVRMRRLWATRNPRTFTEKVRYKMLRDHRRLIVTFADKAAVRAHVAALVGEQVLPRAYAIIDDPERIGDLALPDAAVLKPTHGSGAAIVISPGAAPDIRLPAPSESWVYRHVRRAAAPPEHLVAIGRHWLGQVYGQGPNREWAYGRVPPRIIVEEFLTTPTGGIPDDYKFFVFHGRCEYVQVDAGRFGHRTQDFHDRSWRHLPMSGGPAWAVPPPPRPAKLDEMIALAERLGAGTDFVRVDLYDLGDRIVFGELTSYPAGGDSPFEPESFNASFGKHWTVPRRYR
ncbi:ATP-grasp fold amidoligase family protein [Leifsonia flava]|uniref:Teichuronopeptide biosynthesis TupA-like protein n=1 Tax=Orlajensenia leifsoniae TaxID=2561933 RepID=A0A4Y9R592_9MICO|nr:ATP-grasp fold amidoligase family protein [Leifsonia flava]TFV99811.1 hypothetical protein E4M00_00965 [Leifsonia flava]